MKFKKPELLTVDLDDELKPVEILIDGVMIPFECEIQINSNITCSDSVDADIGVELTIYPAGIVFTKNGKVLRGKR